MIALFLLGLFYGLFAGGAYQLSVLKGTIDDEEEYKTLRKNMREENKRKINEFIDSFKLKDKEDHIQELEEQIKGLKEE